jgi:hypothetical protein
VSSKIYILGGLVCAMALTANSVRAQQAPDQPQDQTQPSPQDPNQGSQQTQPIPAIRSPLAGINGNDQDEQVTQKTLPDTTPLSGIEPISLGKAPLGHNYLQPQFKIFSTADSDELSASGNSGWADFTSFLGGIDVHQSSGISDLSLSYLGGGTIAIGGNAGDSVLQQLGVNEALNWRRVKLTFVEQFSLLPESSFGYAGLGGGVSLPGGGSIGLQPGLTPGDSVLTTRGLRLSNSLLTEADINLDPRSSITVAGGYSLLHYFDNNFLNFGDTIFQVGYNHQMTRKDTFAVFYRFSGYRYSGFNQSINDNSFQVSYGRRVTGRLSFQIAGGPDITFVAVPITGTSAGATPSSGKMQELYWSLSTNVQYQLQRTGFSASYSHGVNGGSGVLAGAIGDTVSASANRQLTRQVNAGVNFGYSHSTGLNAFTTPTAPTMQSYGYWYGGVNLTRTWGRTLDLNLNYTVQYQASNSTFCVGPTCVTNLVRNQISLGLNWHRQPIAF